jgi:hypothetical protein
MVDLAPSALEEPYDPTPINGDPAAHHDEHAIEVNEPVSPVGAAAAAGNVRPSVLQRFKSLSVSPGAYAAALLFAGAAIWQTATHTQEGEAPRQATMGPVVQAPERHVTAQAEKPQPRPAVGPAHATTPAPQRSQPSAVPTKPKALPPARPAVPERNPSPQNPVGSALAAVRQFKADARAQVVSALAPARARAEAIAVRAGRVEGLSLEKLAAQLARIGSASRKEIEDLVPQLKAHAKSGNAEARLWLAHLNAEGLGMARNVGAALEEYAAAARQAAPRLRDEALRRGGQLAAAMLQSEEAQLRGLALKYFETVSAIDPAALTWLGYAHEFGLGVAANPSAARDWYRRAAEAPANADARGYARARLAALAP